jgi:hypothetical protein
MFASKDIFLKSSGGGGYQISRSVRLRSSASAYLNRTPASATNRKTFTFSFWMKLGLVSITEVAFSAGAGGSDSDNLTIGFTGDGKFTCGLWNFSPFLTSQVFRDPSAWYHIVVAIDTTQATATNRVLPYINGNLITAFTTDDRASVTQNMNLAVNNTTGHNIGRNIYGSNYYVDGYLAEFNFIDGQQLTASSFGETNAVTGVWQPKKYAGTYGTNGFYLNFSDNSTAAALGTDFSGNSNTWTVNNISVTAGVTYDSMVDSPTVGATSSNYATLNPLDKAASFTTAGGNLNFTPANTSDLYSCRSTIQIPSTGKWIWEVTNTNSTYMITAGLLSGSTATTGQQTVSCAGMTVGAIGTFFSTTQWMNTTTTWSVTNIGNGDTLVIAYDADAGKIWFGRVASGGSTVTFYNTSGTADPSTGTDPRASGIVAGGWFAGFGTYFTPSGASANFGQRPFAFTNIPTGFVALNTQNLPTPTISNGATVMAATLYTGTGAALTVANTVGSASFQPDLVWVKGRSGATDHALYDAVRGVQNQLESNTTTAETAETTGLTAFGSTGFTIGALAQMNTSAATYVAWQWNAGGSTVTNTSGSISAQVRANPTAGFSVVTYTGTGSAATIGHGLGVAPQMIIIFERSPGGDDHIVYHASLTSNQYSIRLNTAAAQAGPSGAYWNSTSPTSTVFSVGTSGESNQSTATYVAYCFAPVAGYSAFGSYAVNNSADGPFVYLGFRARWILFKNNGASTWNWMIVDTARDAINTVNSRLFPDLSNAESSTASPYLDITANGFKIRTTGGLFNTEGPVFYAAFAENPFKLSLAR